MIPVVLTIFVHKILMPQSAEESAMLRDYFLSELKNGRGIFNFMVFAPVTEELVFRGPAFLVLLITLFVAAEFPDKKRLMVAGGVLYWLVLLGFNYFWAADHQYPITVFAYGLLVGWLMQETKSILYPMLFHAVNNACSMLAIYFGFSVVYK